MGASKWADLNRNHATIIPALYVGDQWQMDGWRIPIYCKRSNEKGGTEYFVTYNLFAVIDAHSRKIIGYDIAESENTETILKSLERAVKDTLTLPFEIVSDNHSFNKTKEAETLKGDIADLGVTWTVDMNPRRKSILERTFRTLGDKHYKKHYGYIGQGVKSRIDTGITQQELKNLYTKPENFLTFEQIVCITVSIIEDYNNSYISKLNDTPNNRYEKSERPHALPVDDFKRLSLFVRKTEHKIRHGQIAICRGEHKYEYQLQAKYSVNYNNKAVGVRYVDFDYIYLYESGTDTPICRVPQKVAIHGALANQTDRDREYLLKNKGRIKGIETQIRKKKENMYDSANTINADAYENIDKRTTSKDVLEKLKMDHELTSKINSEFSFHVDNVNDFPVVDEMLDASLKPKKGKNRHPFHTVKGTMKKIVLDNIEKKTENRHPFHTVEGTMKKIRLDNI